MTLPRQAQDHSDDTRIEWISLGDDALVIDARHSRVSMTNLIGRSLLEMQARGLSRPQMVVALDERFDVSTEQLHADVKTFFDGLHTLPSLVFEPAQAYVPNRRSHVAPMADCEPVHEFSLCGRPLLIRSNEPRLIHRLARCLPAMGRQHSAGEGRSHPASAAVRLDIAHCADGFAIIINSDCVDTALDDDEAVFKALRFVSAHVCRTTPFTAVFHAGAVASGEVGVLLPGIGGRGKTTLCAYLAAAGYQLVNDDTVALLATDRTLLPVPVPLSIKSGSWDIVSSFWPQLSEADTLFPSSAPLKLLQLPAQNWCKQPVVCHLIVLPQYEAGIPTSRLESLTPAQALANLVTAGCFIGDHHTAAQLRPLCQWLTDTPAYRLRFASVAQAKAALDELVAR